MTDVISSLNIMANGDNTALNQNPHENIKISGQNIKGQLVAQMQRNISNQSNNVIHQLLPIKQIGIDDRNSESNANILNNKISQLKCEISNTIIDTIKKYRLRKQGQGNSGDNSNDEMKEDYEFSLEAQIETYLKIMILKIQILLIDMGSIETYKIVTIYELNISSVIKYKQMITLVPYINGAPQRSISEITRVDDQGAVKTINTPSYLIDGGFKYLGNWLSINVCKETINVEVQKLDVQCGLKTLKGYSITCDLEMQQISKKMSHNMYISDFQNIWQ